MNIKALSIGILLSPALLLADDSSAIRALLHGSGDSDGSAVISSVLTPKRSSLTVTAKKLTPEHTFEVEIHGIVEGELKTDRRGNGVARFSTAPGKGKQKLDFDPRGQTVRILDDSGSQVEGVVSGPGEDAGAVINELANLLPENAPAKARAKARYTVSAKGRRTLRVDVANLTGGPFDVYVAGIKRGQITLRGKSGVILFDSAPKNPSAPVLDFDPRGAVVDILDGTTVVFSGQLAAKARGVNEAKPSITGVAITSTGVDADGHAEAKLKIDDKARKHFSVEVEDVPAGSYDLLVDGTAAGTIAVAAVTDGTKGEIEFASGTDDDPSELPLTFDPTGKTLTISLSGVKYFESVFDPNITGAGVPAPEPASQIDEVIASTGLDPDAKGEAKYIVDSKGRHKFSVEIEDVAVGSYTLTVGGVTRGTIVARLVLGKVQGEVEFETEKDGGRSTLTFDPRGQTIEVSNATGIFFSHLLGSGSATPPSTNVSPFDVVVPLISSGADADAEGKAEYKRKDTGSLSFEVEVEDLALGNYDLTVGGTVRGSIAVTATSKGTRGKIKFEDAALNFEVAGQDIGVSQGGTTYFTRTFPTP